MKILFILHGIQKSLNIEWLTNGLLLNNLELSFILLNKNYSELEIFLIDKNIPVVRMYCNNKASAPQFILKLSRKISKIKPDVVHTHLRDADIYGQIAAFFCGVNKRIYTRHSSTYNHLYHKKSILIDRIINFLVTDIIAISEVTKQVLVEMENVKEEKITLIHHGFDLDSFKSVANERIENIKKKYDIPENAIVIGIIARYTKWKGYQYIIPALSALKSKYPDMYFIFANTTGDYYNDIKSMLAIYLPDNSYREMGFENDIQALYKTLNYYIHTPIDKTVEAFGQTYVEALAAGIPSVFSLSGIANEFIVNGENALVVDYENSEQITHAIERLITDKNLCSQLIDRGKQDVKQFNLENYIRKMMAVYQINTK